MVCVLIIQFILHIPPLFKVIDHHYIGLSLCVYLWHILIFLKYKSTSPLHLMMAHLYHILPEEVLETAWKPQQKRILLMSSLSSLVLYKIDLKIFCSRYSLLICSECTSKSVVKLWMFAFYPRTFELGLLIRSLFNQVALFWVGIVHLLNYVPRW